MSHGLDRVWYGHSFWFWLLLPLTGVFRLITAIRRSLYAIGLLRSSHPGVPVIVVGNINVGGTGKTPIVIELCRRLELMGHTPGVASRGYGRQSSGLLEITADTTTEQGGDEPVLIRQRTRCPVVVARKRCDAARRLVQLGCTVIVSDDGLQHYALRRDAEIIVVSGDRGLGNSACLPAGPLREPSDRLQSVDLILINGDGWDYTGAQHFSLVQGNLVHLEYDRTRSLSEFAGSKVHAVAGIGYPDRFFDLLRSNGLEVIAHPQPDHAVLSTDDILFHDGIPVIMTEKDAVKWRHRNLPTDCDAWYLPVSVSLADADAARIDEFLTRVATHNSSDTQH